MAITKENQLFFNLVDCSNNNPSDSKEISNICKSLTKPNGANENAIFHPDLFCLYEFLDIDFDNYFGATHFDSESRFLKLLNDYKKKYPYASISDFITDHFGRSIDFAKAFLILDFFDWKLEFKNHYVYQGRYKGSEDENGDFFIIPKPRDIEYCKHYCKALIDKLKDIELDTYKQQTVQTPQPDKRLKNSNYPSTKIAYSLFHVFGNIIKDLKKEDQVLLLEMITGKSGNDIYQNLTGKNLTITEKKEIEGKLNDIKEKIKSK